MSNLSSLGSGKLVCYPRYLIFIFLKTDTTVRNNIISERAHLQRKREQNNRKIHIVVSSLRMAVGTHANRSATEQRVTNSVKGKTMKTKQNKTENNVTPEKSGISSANKVAGGYKFAPLLADEQWEANQHGHACFELSFSLVLPITFRHTTACRCVQLWLSLQRSMIT